MDIALRRLVAADCVAGAGHLYKAKGQLGGHLPDTGRKIERFTPFERAAHWANAGAFTVLAVSGIVMAFGKFFILPVIGGTFVWLADLCAENMHNFVGRCLRCRWSLCWSRL